MKHIKLYWLLLLLLLPLASIAQEAAGDENTAGTTTMLGTYYADKFVGRKTSTGEIFRQNQYTAAHRTIPFGTYLLVTNSATGCSIVVRVNDRCPVRGVLDMTKLAVHQLGIKGSHKVEVRRLEEAEGRQRWAAQDTLAISEEEYYAFRDRSPHKRISPYPIRPGDPAPRKQHSTKQSGTKPKVAKETSTALAESQSDTASKPIIVRSQPAVIIGTGSAPSDTIDYASLPPKDRRYDIELCIVGSHKAAMKEIGRLPQDLQKKVTLEYNQHTQQTRVILSIADTRSRAVRTQAMISDTFPESCLVLHWGK